MPTAITITPETLNLKCKLTLLSPASHHDPNLGVDANINLYNRQLVRLPMSQRGKPISDRDIEKVATAFPVPLDIFDIFEEEPFARFCGIALIKIFIDRYTHGTEDDWGTGLFTGVEAYKRLSNRIELAAPRAVNLKEFWSILLNDMKCGPMGDPSLLFKVLGVPTGIHHEVLYHLQKYATMIVEMARLWRTTENDMNEEYAKKAKRPQASSETTIPVFKAEDIEDTPREVSVPVPTHSGNDIRHSIRYAAMVHLFHQLGLTLESRLPTGVKALLENGGNIAKGRSAPSTAYALSQEIRERYPSLGLLGGCTDSFLLGDSNLQSVNAFWFGREFNPALESIFGVSADHSVIDMLDYWTLHRHSGRTHDVSPMPYSFETIATGAELYVQFTFSPWTTDLEKGAFYAALDTFQKTGASIGGQAAKGFGKVSVEILDTDAEPYENYKSDYEAYLTQTLVALSEGLQSGTLTTGTVVCT